MFTLKISRRIRIYHPSSLYLWLVSAKHSRCLLKSRRNGIREFAFSNYKSNGEIMATAQTDPTQDKVIIENNVVTTQKQQSRYYSSDQCQEARISLQKMVDING
jgi:hypothetical protein